jgi:hypothetical protein
MTFEAERRLVYSTYETILQLKFLAVLKYAFSYPQNNVYISISGDYE